MGPSLTLPIAQGRFALGTWQGIYLNEHRWAEGLGLPKSHLVHSGIVERCSVQLAKTQAWRPLCSTLQRVPVTMADLCHTQTAVTLR